MGRPEDLGPLIRRALDDALLCAGDPFCAGQEPSGSGQLNGAACHACLLISETACEAGNRHLDRAAVIPTLRESRTPSSTAEALIGLVAGSPTSAIEAIAETLDDDRLTLESSSVGISAIRGVDARTARRCAETFTKVRLRGFG